MRFVVKEILPEILLTAVMVGGGTAVYGGIITRIRPESAKLEICLEVCCARIDSG